MAKTTNRLTTTLTGWTLTLAAAALALEAAAAQSPVPGAVRGDYPVDAGGDLEMGAGCAVGVRDHSVPTACIRASSVPDLGKLMPLNGYFFVGPTGRVGLGTTSPARRLDVIGQSRSQTSVSAGIGFEGLALDTNNPNTGVRGVSQGWGGTGVWGENTNLSGSGYGVRGETSAELGIGVYGIATHATGQPAIGVYGRSFSADGIGVRANAGANSGDTFGVHATVNSSQGTGVYGAGGNLGVHGLLHTTSTGGSAVRGEAQATTGTAHGVYGSTGTSSGAGVRGENSKATGTNYGVYGEAASSNGRGVFGISTHASGFCYGVRGQASSNNGFGVISIGDFASSGTKNFVQPHPADASKEIHFTSLEGNESGTYFRGSAQLQGGVALVAVPEAFRLVSEAAGLTVQVTAIGRAQVWVEAYDLDHVVVRGAPDVEFHYTVNGVRRGFSQHRTIRENRHFVPEQYGVPFGTQYPDDLRRILVENGTLNADFTPNAATAAQLGWDVR